MKVEDGTGVFGANSYTTVAWADAYLADRGRSIENSWSSKSSPLKENALVVGTYYIETRWGLRFKGTKLYQNICSARGTLTMSSLPANGETVTLGATTYTFNSLLGGANSVLIGASVSDTLDNLVNAILATADQASVTHGSGTAANASATAEAGIGDTLIATAKVHGTPGNSVASTSTASGSTWSAATLLGGSDYNIPQELSFPRQNLYTREGVLVQGIPLKLQGATVEYAVRSLASDLMPDPTMDATGKAVTMLKEKIGPIETETHYEDGSARSGLLRSYPAADRMLQEYLKAAGGVVRG